VNNSQLEGYWGPTKGLTLDLRKARPNPFWAETRTYNISNINNYKLYYLKL